MKCYGNIGDVLNLNFSFKKFANSQKVNNILIKENENFKAFCKNIFYVVGNIFNQRYNSSIFLRFFSIHF